MDWKPWIEKLSHIGSMGLVWYIYLYEWLILDGKLVGKYTVRPMDPMGMGKNVRKNIIFGVFWVGNSSNVEG